MLLENVLDYVNLEIAELFIKNGITEEEFKQFEDEEENEINLTFFGGKATKHINK